MKTFNMLKNKTLSMALISLALAAIFITAVGMTPFTDPISLKIYDELLKLEYKLKGPATPQELVLVTIDNDTLNSISERWPYPRAMFAKVIDNLENAGAKAIGLDLIFYGNSGSDDAILETSLDGRNNVVFGATIDEEGKLNVSTSRVLAGGKAVSGFLTKFQDGDGMNRRSLTYLVDAGDKKIGFLSWDMALLKAAKGADFSTLADDGTTISFRSNSGEEWNIPVDRHARSFLIHFRSHTADFRRISFYKVLEGDFDPSLVKGKIVLVGLLSSIFGDLHNTPIGWLPGITLNANVVSALYSHDFLKEVPMPVEIFLVILGILLAALTVRSQSLRRSLIPIIALIALFLGLSFILLSRGYVWNYAIFPLAVFICPLVAKKIYLIIKAR